MSFSAGGKRHSHTVVKALYYELLRRIMSKKVVWSKPLSIVESVMPKRESWRGVGGKDEKVEVFKRYVLYVCVTCSYTYNIITVSCHHT